MKSSMDRRRQEKSEVRMPVLLTVKTAQQAGSGGDRPFTAQPTPYK